MIVNFYKRVCEQDVEQVDPMTNLNCLQYQRYDLEKKKQSAFKVLQSNVKWAENAYVQCH